MIRKNWSFLLLCLNIIDIEIIWNKTGENNPYEVDDSDCQCLDNKVTASGTQFLANLAVSCVEGND